MKHERLFLVSLLGFFVNMIGIFAFQHGHSHGAGGNGAISLLLLVNAFK